MKKIMLFTIMYLLLPCVANSSSINFNIPTLSGGIQTIDTYTERGVTFRGAFNHVDALSGDASNGTAYMQYGSASSLNFARSDNSLMNLVSIDLAELSSAPVSVTFLAQLSGSEIISQTFTTDGVFGPGNDFQTFFFDSTFTGVEHVSIADASGLMNYNFAFDNVKLSAVPVPAALWLFLSGLITLVGFSKRRNN